MAEASKEGFFKKTGNSLGGYVRELRAELKKVVWPTFKQVRNNTGVVITAIILVGIFVALLDFGFGALVSNLLK